MALNTTFVANTTVITAAHMNGLQSAWASYGSGSSWTAATSNPAIGNGTWVGHFQQVGKNIDFWVKITMGSTTTYGTGGYRIALPVAPISGHGCRFDCYYTDSGVNAYRGVTGLVSGSTIALLVDNSTAGGALQAVTPTVPFTFGNTDIIEVMGRYEAA